MNFFRGKTVVLDGCNMLIKTPWKEIGMAGQNSTHMQKVQYTVQPFL